MPRLLLCPLLLVITSVAAHAQSEPSWPHWRGPARDGVSRETKWSTRGDAKPRWTVDLGHGYSNVAIANGQLFTMGFDTERGLDQLFCLDVLTGREVWRHTWAADIRANFHGGGSATTPRNSASRSPSTGSRPRRSP